MSSEQATDLPGIDELLDFSSSRGRKATSSVEQLRFLVEATDWLRRNTNSFDIFYAPTNNKLTLGPAVLAVRQGLPAVCRIAAARAELHNVSKLRSALGFNRLRVALMKRLSGIVAISRQVEDRLNILNVPGGLIFRLPNGVDIQRFRPANRAEKKSARLRYGVPPEAGSVIVNVGAVGNRKGQHLLVEALPYLAAHAHLLLVGPDRDIEYGKRLDARIVELGLSTRVTRISHVKDIETAYWAGEIFALPSLDEGMPNSMLEAMACGLACVGTPVSGTEELLAGGGRGTICSRDQSTITSALRGYCDDLSLRRLHGAAARLYVEGHHDSACIAKHMFDYLLSQSRLSQAEPK